MSGSAESRSARKSSPTTASARAFGSSQMACSHATPPIGSGPHKPAGRSRSFVSSRGSSRAATGVLALSAFLPAPVNEIVARTRELGLLVGQHADHDTVRVANEEATDAPRFINRTVDDLVPGLDCFSMRRIDGCPRIDVHAHVGQPWLNPWRREEHLRLAGPEADVAAAEVPLLEPEHPRIEGARGLEVRRLVVGHDASDSHTDGVSQSIAYLAGLWRRRSCTSTTSAGVASASCTRSTSNR